MRALLAELADVLADRAEEKGDHEYAVSQRRFADIQRWCAERPPVSTERYYYDEDDQ